MWVTCGSRPSHVRVTSESRPSHIRVTSESRVGPVQVTSLARLLDTWHRGRRHLTRFVPSEPTESYEYIYIYIYTCCGHRPCKAFAVGRPFTLPTRKIGKALSGTRRRRALARLALSQPRHSHPSHRIRVRPGSKEGPLGAAALLCGGGGGVSVQGRRPVV